MELKEYIEKYHSSVLVEYKRHEAGWNTLKIGTKVRTLHAGFCGEAGVIRIITESCKDNFGEFLVLKPVGAKPEDRGSLLYRRKNWWQSVEIIE